MLSVLGLILAALASLDLTGITAVLPPEYAGKALAAGLAIAALRDAVLMFGDLADDGKRNNSWQPLVAWLAVPVFLLALPSCVETTTTNPDGTTVKTKAPDRELVGQALTTAGQLAAAKASAKNAGSNRNLNVAYDESGALLRPLHEK